jgi:hypothetical protein
MSPQAGRRELLVGLGATGATLEELSGYLDDAYRGLAGAATPPEEPQTAFWRRCAAEAARHGVVRALARRFPQFGFPIEAGISQSPGYRAATRQGRFSPDAPAVVGIEREDRLSLRVDEGFAGPVPVLVARHRPDFVRLVQALTARNEPEEVPAAMGACLVKGLANWERVGEYRRLWEKRLGHPASDEAWAAEMATQLAPRKELWQDRLILLSDGPYSAVPAAELGLTDEAWRERSLALRLAHETFHYLTLRRAGTLRSHLLDELLADYAGLVAAFGRYEAARALRFLGLDRLPEIRPEGRLAVYRGNLTDEALAVLARLVARAAAELETLSVETADPAQTAARLAHLAGFGLDGLATPELAGRLARELAAG